MRRIQAWRRSMVAQIGLLTVLFIGWGIYSIALRPLWQLPDVAVVDPLQDTSIRLRTLIQEQIVLNRDRPGTLAGLSSQPLMREVLRRNPQFRYFIRVGDSTFANTKESAPYEQLRLAELTRLLGSIGESQLCAQMSKPTAAGRTLGYMTYVNCGTSYYFDYVGLARPVPAMRPDAAPLIDRRIWQYSESFLIAVAGLVGIVAAVIAINLLMIRRVSRLARCIDPEKRDVYLPERGLATELLPLVRAINTLIAGINGVWRRNDFFMSAAAHEMRTPLTVLRTRLELLDDGPLKDKAIGDVRRLIDLVNQLLALMSIGSHRSDRQAVDLAVCCRRAVAECEPLAAERGVEIALEYDVPERPVVGEKALIRSALSNLVRNAVAFSLAGARVVVRLRGDGSVTVADRGPGIPPDQLDAVFEPFVRFPANGRGHGLGLAIVTAIVNLHQGAVRADPAEGGGTVFTIRFDEG